MIPALTILHIAIAAAWFGHKLLIPGDIRRSAGAGQDEALALLRRLRRAERLGRLTGLGTVVSGGLLAWVVGIGKVGVATWVGAGLVVVAIAIGAVIARPAMKTLVAAAESGDRIAASVAGAQIGRVLGIESLLWLGALTAMVL
ncbi:MAG TPA: hypothetical protein VG872_12205 [Acidimicrobiia bacterium]|jgi:hypothetical protein|nr:hypothetical protein [Acidimicrobiia bacterium]